jgi:hypothetical protein
MRWTALFLFLPICFWQPAAQPQITTFTVSVELCMSHNACATFHWETVGAQRVSLESGSIEDGIFRPGGWHSDKDLPPNGSSGFIPKIDNYAGRLCIVMPEPVGEPVCAVCNPWEPDTCR